MNKDNAAYLAGYWFSCEACKVEDGQTTIDMSVCGDGTALRDFDAWAVELYCVEAGGAQDVRLISCEMRRPGGAWMPASAQTSSAELTADVGFDGVVVEESVGKDAEDARIDFRLKAAGRVSLPFASFAYISGDTVVRSRDKLRLCDRADCCEDKVWLTPITQSFCLYVAVPEGYKPLGACKVGLSVLRRGMYLHNEAGTFDAQCDCGAARMTGKAHLSGVVKITASVPLKSRRASGDPAWVTACDCFEIDETIGYARGLASFALRDISIRPKKGSVDLTLLNAHCGKSVYRLDGAFTIHCKRCATHDLGAIE